MIECNSFTRKTNTSIANLNTVSKVPHKHTIIAKGDSAASRNYWRPNDVECLTNMTHYTGPSVVLPDADTLAPSHQGLINLHKKTIC